MSAGNADVNSFAMPCVALSVDGGILPAGRFTGMRIERAAWFGNVLLAAVTVFLTWVPVASQVGRWGSIAIAVVVVIAVVVLYPRRGPDGSVTRLADRFRPNVTTGDNSDVQIARDHANQTIIRGNKNKPGR